MKQNCWLSRLHLETCKVINENGPTNRLRKTGFRFTIDSNRAQLPNTRASSIESPNLFVGNSADATRTGNKVGELVRRTIPSTRNFLESCNSMPFTVISNGGVTSRCCASQAGLILVPHGALPVCAFICYDRNASHLGNLTKAIETLTSQPTLDDVSRWGGCLGSH